MARNLHNRNTFGIVLLKMSYKFTLALISTDPNSQSQPDAIDPNIYVHLGNDSIKVLNQNLTWDDAMRQCEGEKANLASLRNQWTQAYIELLSMKLKAPLWIGLNKEKVCVYLCSHNRIYLHFKKVFWLLLFKISK